MDPTVLRVLMVVFVVWGGAVAWKAWNALQTGEPYTFSIWDGGMLRAGKKLSRTGAQVKLGVGIAMAVLCLLFVSNVLVGMPAVGLLVVVAAVSLISDFTNTAA